MTDHRLLDEFAELFRQLLREFDLTGQVFRRKLKVPRRNVNRWENAECWPSPDQWDQFKRTAVESLSEPRRGLLKEKLAQLDELIRRKNSMKIGSSRGRTKPFPNADRDVLFWHSFRDREEDGRGVGKLINNAEKRIIISGASLHQLVFRFETDILRALKSRVLVGVIRCHLIPDLCKLYGPYGRFDSASLSNTEKRYEELWDKLSQSQREHFGLFETDILLTHSIGLYDDELFVAEFIMRQHSELCPTYKPPLHSSTYRMLLSELSVLLKAAKIRFGAAKPKLLESIELDAMNSTQAGRRDQPQP